jgi:hypothetical protein
VEQASAVCHPAARAAASYSPRQAERTTLYQVMQANLATFLQRWQGDGEGRALPRHVTGELREFLTCGIAQHGFAHLHCASCQARHVVPWSCKGRGFCPSCGGRRMNEGAANLVDHVLPEGVAVRQWVLTLPSPLRFPLAFDARLLGAVHRLFTDTVAAFYRKRAAPSCGKARPEYGGLTVIQRAWSDLRCNPHFHTLFLDGLCGYPHRPSYADIRIMLSCHRRCRFAGGAREVKVRIIKGRRGRRAGDHPPETVGFGWRVPEGKREPSLSF